VWCVSLATNYMVSHNYRTGPPSAKWQNFATSGPMFHNFYCSIRKGSAEEGGIKNTTSPQKGSNLLPHYLVESKWSTIQLYGTVNSVQSDEKCLIMVNVHEVCYFFIFLHRLIYVMFALGTNACFKSWMPLVNGCVNCAIVQRCAKHLSS